MVEVTKIENGYLVTTPSRSFGDDQLYAFNNFADMMDFLFKHFGEVNEK